MDLTVYIQLIFLFGVNIIFAFSGIVSNTLVIVSILKSRQLRKKLCHFMILVLSCCDLVTVVTIYPGLLLYLISWLREDYDLLSRMKFYLHMVGVFVAFSFLALLVMNIERYLGTYYPIFRTSVTRLRLLTLLAMLLIPSIVIFTISRNGLVVSAPVFLIFFMGSFFLLFIFVNFKLFNIARKVHRTVSPETRTRVNLKNISMGLWVVACLIFLSIPNSLYIALYFAEKSASEKSVFHLGRHRQHYELRIKQFDLFLEEQSFTRRRNKDTKDVERSSCRILKKLLSINYIMFHRLLQTIKAGRPNQTSNSNFPRSINHS